MGGFRVRGQGGQTFPPPEEGAGEDRRRRRHAKGGVHALAVRQPGHQGPQSLYRRQGDEAVIKVRDLGPDLRAGGAEGGPQVGWQVRPQVRPEAGADRLEVRNARQVLQGRAPQDQAACLPVDIREHGVRSDDRFQSGFHDNPLSLAGHVKRTQRLRD